MSGLCEPRGDGESPVKCYESPLLAHNRSAAIRVFDDSIVSEAAELPASAEEESKEERKKTYDIEGRGKV